MTFTSTAWTIFQSLTLNTAGKSKHSPPPNISSYSCNSSMVFLIPCRWIDVHSSFKNTWSHSWFDSAKRYWSLLAEVFFVGTDRDGRHKVKNFRLMHLLARCIKTALANKNRTKNQAERHCNCWDERRPAVQKGRNIRKWHSTLNMEATEWTHEPVIPEGENNGNTLFLVKQKWHEGERHRKQHIIEQCFVRKCQCQYRISLTY